MSENTSNLNLENAQHQADERLSQKIEEQLNKKLSLKPKAKLSKLALLLALIALASSAFLAYQGIYGKFGIRYQLALKYAQTSQIEALMVQNRQLQQQVTDLQQNQQALAEQLKNINPKQSKLIIYQLNNLIAGANQSLLLFHDYAAAIKQLSYAKELLNSVSDAMFSDLKISLSQDLDSLQALNSFDNSMLATQLEDAFRAATSMKLTSELRPKLVSTTATSSLWDKFIANSKQSLLGLVSVVKSNPNAQQSLIPENELALRAHLQLDLQGAKQALMSHNPQLWGDSLADAIRLIQTYFVDDLARQKGLGILSQLQMVSFAGDQANLDLTMQALIKLEQLTDGK